MQDRNVTRNNLKISVRNFGPILSGDFRIRPLTIFIGPNNSGKSYAALLVYAVSKALLNSFLQPLFRGSTTEQSEVDSEFLEWIKRYHRTAREITVASLPIGMQREVQEGIDRSSSLVSRNVELSLEDYFGIDRVSQLVSLRDDSKLLSIDVNPSDQCSSFLSIQIRHKRSAADVHVSLPDVSRLRVNPRAALHQIPFPWHPELERTLFPGVGRRALRNQVASRLLTEQGISVGEVFYLPSGRSGILQGWPVFASVAVDMVRSRVGLEYIEVPPLTGVAGDFVQVLLRRLMAGPRRRELPRAMRSALDMIEGEMFRGRATVSFPSRAERPSMVYSTGRLKLPLHRASSMVGELAPLDLWIKYLLDSGDLLIIDEPESHLHPENQLRVARVLARLARAGVQVLCPTHSSLILHQLSNLILASSVAPSVRASLGLTDMEVLDPDDVGVYLFEPTHSGTIIRELTIEPDFGIPEEEFIRVAEAIGEETYKLSAAQL